MQSFLSAPPRLAEWLLSRVVPDGPVGRSMVGDARQEFVSASRQSGKGRAMVSYWATTLSIAIRFIPTRVRTRGPWHRMGMRDAFNGAGADLRHAGRLLVRQPGLILTAVFTIALGMAAPATMFSITSGILADLPFENGDRIVAVQMNDPVRGFVDMGVSADDYRVWSERQQMLADIAGFDRLTAQVSGAPDAPPALIEAAAMTPTAFAVLGVVPVRGRSFTVSDALPRSTPVVIIGYRIWQDLFAGRASAIGAVLRVNDELRTVVGVMPDGFEFPRREQMWLPLATYTGADVEPFSVFGRLRDEVSLGTAGVDFDAIARAMAAEHPDTHGDVTITLLNYARAGLGDDTGRIMLYALTCLMSFVLLIACVNVANLLLARTLGRSRELAVRMALGASRVRLMRHLMVESALIALLGGIAGVILASLTADWFNQRIASQVNMFWIVIEMDLGVLAFCGLLVVGAAVLSGLLPAWQAAGIDLRSAIDDGSRGATGFRAGRIHRGLVTAEVAISCSLLILSGLMVRGVLDLFAKDAAFGQDQVLTARMLLQDFDYDAPSTRRVFWEDLRNRLEAQAGVDRLAITTRLPGVGVPRWRIAVSGRESEENLTAGRIETTPSFFQLFGVPAIEGRLLTESDTERSLPVAVVTRAFAREMFPGESAVGRRFRFTAVEDTTWIHIVGVVEDGGVFSRDATVQPGAYQPIRQTAPRRATLAIRTRGDPYRVVNGVRADVASIDPHLPLYEVDTLLGRIIEESQFERLLGILFGTFGAIALAMATVGLYGVVSFSVGTRRHELGIRKALGAQQVSIVWVPMRTAIISLVVGVAIGAGVAMLLAPMVRDALFGRSPTDLTVYAAVVAVLSIATLTAALVPALRAARLDPARVLRF
jgi:predicted permease